MNFFFKHIIHPKHIYFISQIMKYLLENACILKSYLCWMYMFLHSKILTDKQGILLSSFDVST